VIAQHERGLLFKNGMLQAVLLPGVYRWLDLSGAVRVEVHDLTRPELAHPHAELFVKDAPALCQAHFQVVETGQQEIGLVYYNGRLAGVVPPGSLRLYWQGPVEVRVERRDLSERFALEPRLAAYLVQSRKDGPWPAFADYVYEEEVPDHHVGLLIVDGRLVETLAPGLHAYWRCNRSIQVELVDTRLQAMEVQGQEILTRDKVSLRLNLTAHYRVSDAALARARLPRYKDHLYRELQLALRQAVGGRTLDALLEEKGALERELREAIKERAVPFGLEVETLGIRDVILPGDMKAILNQVVEAEKAAQANLIRRREETAATRSLLNTARLMEQNPVLLRLKELESLERVTERIGSLTVFGGLEGVLQGLVRIGPGAQ
jgi:regulator of protease activity HflC (stomatin/prohibitin superfamily)